LTYPKGKPYPESGKDNIRLSVNSPDAKIKKQAWLNSPQGLLYRQRATERMLGENNPAKLKVWTEEERQIHSLRMTGIKRTEEQKKHYSESKMGFRNPNYGKNDFPGLLAMMQAIREHHPMLGKHHSEKTKRKLRHSHLGKSWGNHTPESKMKISIARKGKYKGIAPWNKGLKAEDDSRILTGADNIFGRVKFMGEANGFFGKHHTQESIEKILNNRKYAGPTFPNKPEERLLEILESLYPRRYCYTGNMRLPENPRLRPDFSSRNGEREIIELFGNYWHSQLITGRNKEEEEKQRIDALANYGYKILIIWECELEDEEALIQKIKSFVEVDQYVRVN